MIAISSFKPFGKSAAIADNQRRAKASWDKVFSRVIYVGKWIEPELDTHISADKWSTTTWAHSEDFPTISELVALATKQTEWSCLINADIVVSTNIIYVERELNRLKAQSAISRRWQLPENRVVDMGLDWFAATPELWQAIYPHVPKNFRIGHILWDTWMLSAFTGIGDPRRSYDITACRTIFHPKHEDRDRPFSDKINDKVSLNPIIKWPKPMIIQEAIKSYEPARR